MSPFFQIGNIRHRPKVPSIKMGVIVLISVTYLLLKNLYGVPCWRVFGKYAGIGAMDVGLKGRPHLLSIREGPGKTPQRLRSCCRIRGAQSGCRAGTAVCHGWFKGVKIRAQRGLRGQIGQYNRAVRTSFSACSLTFPKSKGAGKSLFRADERKVPSADKCAFESRSSLWNGFFLWLRSV